MECSRCAHSETARREWGCDAPAAVPVARIVCQHCHAHGAGCEACASCAVCGGLGYEMIHRCPRRTVPPWAFAVVECAIDWERGISPISGCGVLDLPQRLISAMNFCLGLISELRERKMRSHASR